MANDGSPIAVNGDGNLHDLCGFSRTGLTDPGGPPIGRVSPDRKLTVLAPALKAAVGTLYGITGLAAGPGGWLCAACPSAVLKLAPDGTPSTLVHPVVVADYADDRASKFRRTSFALKSAL